MSAPLSGTKTRVVGFLKGLFGKGNATPAETTHDITFNYHQAAPLTGAQLKSPAAVPPIAGTSINGHAAAPVAAPQKSGNVSPATGLVAIAQKAAPTNGHTTGHSVNGHNGNGHTNGNGNGHVNGQAAAPQPMMVKPAAPSAPIPIAIKPHNGNGNGVHAPVVAPAKPAGTTGQFINLPLTALIAALPAELQPRVLKPASSDGTVAVALETVMAQLPTGVVKISFGALRESAPQFFTPLADADQTMITLPLGEVLRQINPAQLAKPANQMRLTAADDIASPFADKGSNAKLEVNGTSSARSITPETTATPRPGLGEIAKPTPPTANVPPPVRINLPQTPAAAPIPAPAALKLSGDTSLRMAGAPVAPVTPAPAPVVAPAPATDSPPAASQACLTVALKSLVDTWPDAVKKEILEHSLLNGSVDLPMAMIATQLKTGRVAVTWDQIRSWITPRPGIESAHGTVELELPLRIVAPLFVGLKSTDAKTHRLAADEKIPNVFNSVACPAAPAVATAPAVTVKPVPAVELPAGMSPEAVVKRAASLNGVAGALVALPDGLVVASRLPAGQQGDSLAAFLPQIYAKFDACLKDLNMAELNNLNFTAGDVPWRVFRTNSVFFAAFGRPGEILPGDWLATLAGELEKK